MSKPITEAELLAMEQSAALEDAGPGTYEADVIRLVAEVRRQRKKSEEAVAVAGMLRDDAEAGIAWQQRPKGGQQIGCPSTSFCNAPPSAIAAIKRQCRWIAELLKDKS